jgi:60 kDa SS-A/Ro ribonucleoprotein
VICIDLQPLTSTQAAERQDIINVGGFSDDVFRLIGEVANGRGGGFWVEEIEEIEL